MSKRKPGWSISKDNKLTCPHIFILDFTNYNYKNNTYYKSLSDFYETSLLQISPRGIFSGGGAINTQLPKKPIKDFQYEGLFGGEFIRGVGLIRGGGGGY